MTYRSLLVTRWSRRDRLAVLVVALAVALLVGATLLAVTAGDQTRSLAADFETNATVAEYDSLEEARAESGENATVLPLAEARTPDGATYAAVGVPESTLEEVALPARPEGAVGPTSEDETWELEGSERSAALTVSPGVSSGAIPETWVRTTPEAIEAVGPTGALVVEPASGDAAGDSGSPLVGALAFFAGGTQSVIGLLWVGAAVAAIVVAVTVSSVVRTTIRERARTIRVIRATGGPPRRLRLLFAARGGVLAGAGAGLGYAVGVIVPNVAVNLAILLGLPTTLSIRVTRDAAALLVVMLAVLVAVGLASGYLAGRRATTVPPARVGDERARGRSTDSGLVARGRELLAPSLLEARTVVPAAATLSVFAVIVLLIGSLAAVGGALTTDETTITEPGAPHPIESSVPESYAGAVDGDTAASPEILLFGSHDGEPYLARGVEYDAFAAVTDARLVDGGPPENRSHAVIGTSLADTLGLEPGDELVVGGSTDAAFERVEIAGVYETGALEDHQLLVSLSTARHLSTVDAGEVNLVRTDASAPDAEAEAAPVLVEADAPDHAEPDDPIPVSVTLWNPGEEPAERTITAAIDDESVERTVSIDAGAQTTETIELPGVDAGEYEISVGSFTRTATVAAEPPLEFASLPETAPPGETTRVALVDATGEPVENATAASDAETATTDEDGAAWIALPEETGTAEIEAQAGDRNRNESVTLSEDASRTVLAETSLEPATPGIHSSPEFAVELSNPWDRTVEHAVEIDGPETSASEAVELEPGETATVTTTLPQRPPGEYGVAVSADGETLATHEYEVEGDDRLTGALAASGHYDDGGGVGPAIEYAVGNLHVLLASLVGLASLTVVGATSAVLTRAVRARRRSLGIYRATGATPRQLLGLVLADAVRIGLAASLVALVVATATLEALALSGRLTVFGVGLEPRPAPALALGVVVGGTVLTGISALVAVRSLLRVSPASLFASAEPGGDVGSAAAGSGSAGGGVAGSRGTPGPAESET